VSEEKLDLFEFAARRPTTPEAIKSPVKMEIRAQYSGCGIARRSAEEASPERTLILLAWLRRPSSNLGTQAGEERFSGDANA